MLLVLASIGEVTVLLPRSARNAAVPARPLALVGIPARACSHQRVAHRSASTPHKAPVRGVRTFPDRRAVEAAYLERYRAGDHL